MVYEYCREGFWVTRWVLSTAVVVVMVFAQTGCQLEMPLVAACLVG